MFFHNPAMHFNTKKYEGSWKPSALQELLLRASLLKGENAVCAWRKWKSDVEVENLDPASHRMLPLLYRNLQAHGIEDPSMGIYKGVYRQTWYKNQLLFQALASVLRSFGDAGMETMVLKGAALTVLNYKDYGLRPMKDLDVLIRIENVLPAVELLQRLGWTPVDFEPTWKYISVSYSHGFRNGNGQEIDIHWHILSQSREPKADGDFWEGATTVNINGVVTRALNPTDQLFHVCIHGARWNYIPPFRWIADAMAILSTSKPEIDWDRLLERAVKRRLVLPLKNSLNYLRYVVDAPVPPEALRRIQQMPVSKIDHIEYKINIGHPNRWKAMLDLWCQHSRLSGDKRLFSQLVSFPKFLGCIWDRSLWGMPFYAVSRVMNWRKIIP